jgi:signal peptidase I
MHVNVSMQPNKIMTEEQLGIQMVMATAPAQTVQAVPMPGGPRFPIFSFDLARLFQKAMMFALIGVLSTLSYLVISSYFVKSVKVVGSSMVPTLRENSRYLLNVWALRNRDPVRNDIVVIRDPGDHGLSVKRVIAVGGQSILFKEGKVFVDGKQLDEPYLLPHTRTFTYSQAKEQFITCGRDQYFVLGDNRLVSIDSRSYGPVSRQDVLGLVEKR